MILRRADLEGRLRELTAEHQTLTKRRERLRQERVALEATFVKLADFSQLTKDAANVLRTERTNEGRVPCMEPCYLCHRTMYFSSKNGKHEGCHMNELNDAEM